MKKKRCLISSIIQLIVGILAIIAFAILTINGENINRWIVTLILSILYIVLGIIGIIGYKNQKIMVLVNKKY